VFHATCDALGAAGGAGWRSRDPHLDAASGRLSDERRRILETLEKGT
jgi:hypothetical protein